MKVDQKILTRLNELIEMGERVIKTRYDRSLQGIMFADDGVEYGLANQWGVSCLSILGRVFDRQADHYTKFDLLFKDFENYSPIIKALGILKSAKEEYEQGFLFETRVLIEAEVFDDFLEQAEHLLLSGYFQPAAVIVGSVLEDGLRKLCQRNGVSIAVQPKLDQMNADLAKQGIYNKLVQKRITALADIRNNAAHGRWEEFTKDDVEDMLKQTRSFMETHFT